MGSTRRCAAQWLREEWLLATLMAAFPVMLLLAPMGPAGLAALVDWKTIAALAGLMALSRGLEISGALDRAGRALVTRLRSERGLACALIVFSAALSAVVTNDVALFIVVPLTMGLRSAGELPVGRLVIFEALAVNAGSAVSPVGNPQNLLLWQASGAGFGEFVMALAPLSAAMMLALLALTVAAFSGKPIALAERASPLPQRPRLFALSLGAYPAFLLALNLQLAAPAAIVVLGAFLVWFRPVLRGVDWPLLLIFILMFANLGLLGQVPAVAEQMPGLLALPGGVYTVSALLSQGISNVPAAIFLQPFTDDWRALAWGVSVGGFGLAIGSLANLIALRLARLPGIWREFHLWSGPMWAFSFAAGILLL